MKTIAWSGIIGLFLAAFVGAVYGYRGFEEEPAPMLSRELCMLIGAFVFSLGGMVVGIGVGIPILLSSTPPGDKPGAPHNSN